VSLSLQDIQDAANRLVKPPRKRDPLPAPVARQAIGDGIGFAEPQQPKASGVGGGIAAPLKEIAFSKREYYTEEIVRTTPDGIFTDSRKRIKKVIFQDAVKAVIPFEFAAPPPPPEE
jgi:hypothetical protein